MAEKEIIKMLQYQRHDMMNHLQVIHGYISMGNTEKAKAKMMSWMDDLAEERKLFHLQAPQFVLWLMQVNHLQTNLRLSYGIETERDLHTVDKELTRQCRQVLACIEQEADQEFLYQGKLTLNENEKSAAVQVNIALDGPFFSLENIEKRLKDTENAFPVYLKKIEKGIICVFSMPCHF